MASEPKHRKIEYPTQAVSSENEETTSTEDEENLFDEKTSSTCKFICSLLYSNRILL